MKVRAHVFIFFKLASKLQSVWCVGVSGQRRSPNGRNDCLTVRMWFGAWRISMRNGALLFFLFVPVRLLFFFASFGNMFSYLWSYTSSIWLSSYCQEGEAG
jgi:hypothetical protein